jgi:hypothetical protein
MYLHLDRSESLGQGLRLGRGGNHYSVKRGYRARRGFPRVLPSPEVRLGRGRVLSDRRAGSRANHDSSFLDLVECAL